MWILVSDSRLRACGFTSDVDSHVQAAAEGAGIRVALLASRAAEGA